MNLRKLDYEHDDDYDHEHGNSSFLPTRSALIESRRSAGVNQAWGAETYFHVTPIVASSLNRSTGSCIDQAMPRSSSTRKSGSSKVQA